MSDVQVRRVAKQLALLQIQIFPAHFMDGFRGELSLLDLAALGLMVVTTSSDQLTPDRRAFKVAPMMMSLLFQSRDNPIVLEDYFYNLIVESRISPAELLEMSRTLRRSLEEPGTVRGLIKEAAHNLLPPQKAGRPAKLDRQNWQILLETADQVRPLCTALSRLRRVAKNRKLEDDLNYLELDYPQAVEFIRSHIEEAKRVFSDLSFLSGVKSPKVRSVRLADAIAGLKFKLKPKYAIQQTARARNERRKQSAE
jgi:hypothetical protein